MVTAASPRNAAVDVLKLVLAIMVIGIHGNFLDDVDGFLGYLAHNGLFRVAVPTFFVINGFYFERIAQYRLGRWLRRVVLMFLIWTTIYAIDWYPAAHGALFAFFKAYLIGYYQLWYLQALAIGGAMLFLLRKRSSATLLGLSVGLFLFGTFIEYGGFLRLFAGTALDEASRNFLYYRNALFVALPFLILGFEISRHEAALDRIRPYLLPALLLSVAGLLAEATLNYGATGAPHRELDLMFGLLPLCPLLFLYAKSLQVAGNSRVISQIATGIFLVHLLLLNQIDHYMTNSLAVVVTAVASALVSLALIRLNRYVPLL